MVLIGSVKKPRNTQSIHISDEEGRIAMGKKKCAPNVAPRRKYVLSDSKQKSLGFIGLGGH